MDHRYASDIPFTDSFSALRWLLSRSCSLSRAAFSFFRAGMLEALMKRPGCIDPAEIEDEQLRAFLASLLSLSGAESKLTELLPPDSSGDNLEPDGGDNLTS